MCIFICAYGNKIFFYYPYESTNVFVFSTKMYRQFLYFVIFITEQNNKNTYKKNLPHGIALLSEYGLTNRGWTCCI